MSRDGRRTSGPLSTTQQQIISAIIAGERQKEIAGWMECSQQHVSDELYVTRSKLWCQTTAQAAAAYSRALTYLRAADLVDKAKVQTPDRAVDRHVNHVLDGIAKQYRTLAAQILPQEEP